MVLGVPGAWVVDSSVVKASVVATKRKRLKNIYL
jgi:hypothetical protein